MKIQPMTIEETKFYLFFDNGVEVSLRTKKARLTKDIKLSEEQLNDIKESYKRRTETQPFAWYLGEKYTHRDIKSMEIELTELKALRSELNNL